MRVGLGDVVKVGGLLGRVMETPGHTLDHVSYAFDNDKPFGARVIEDRMMLNGARIAPAQNYRVTVNNYLALGGDGFTVLKQATAAQFGSYDADALFAYVQANTPISPGVPDRIARVN